MLRKINRHCYTDVFGEFLIKYSFSDRCWVMLPQYGGVVYYSGNLETCADIIRKQRPHLYSNSLFNLMYGYDKPTLIEKIKGWFK